MNPNRKVYVQGHPSSQAATWTKALGVVNRGVSRTLTVRKSSPKPTGQGVNQRKDLEQAEAWSKDMAPGLQPAQSFTSATQSLELAALEP